MSNLVSVVKAVTDSASGISAAIARGLGITLVPCNVHLGDRTHRDRVDLRSEEFFIELAKSPVLLMTSQPAVGIFGETYRRLAEEADQILSLYLPARLSATLNSARLAAQSFPELEIAITDPTQVYMAQRWLAIIAARAARQGRRLAEIVALVKNTICRLRLIALADTLEYLLKGGGIGKEAALLGTLPNVKPLLKPWTVRRCPWRMCEPDGRPCDGWWRSSATWDHWKIWPSCMLTPRPSPGG